MNNKFPFRVGCTSYVIPDDILPNIRKTAPLFDDIEIVLFESSDFSNMPSKKTIIEIGKILKDNDTTATIHFPIDRDAGSVDATERSLLAKQAIDIINLFEPVNPYSYILHLQGLAWNGQPDKPRGEDAVLKWHQYASEVCYNISSKMGEESHRISVENLGYPIEWHEDIVERNGFTYCFDVGHTWLYFDNWFEVLLKYLPKTRVIHLHGENSGKDHISLCDMDLHRLKKVFNEIYANYSNLVTLEVFNEKDLFGSEKLLISLAENLK